MPPSESADAARKRRGGWYTPEHLVDLVVSRTLTAEWVRSRTVPSRPVHVVDPACGDGRFLNAAAARLATLGRAVTLTGIDVDPRAVAEARRRLLAAGHHEVRIVHADALDTGSLDTGAIPAEGFDVVLGNPPFLSQLAAATTRGGASRHGGGPYANAAVEFLARSVDLVGPGGRIGLVLPQSVLASRDAAAVRRRVDETCAHRWSWWSPDRHFDAEVVVCAIGLERTTGGEASGRPNGVDDSWAHVIARSRGVPELPPLRSDGTVAHRTHRNANFRDEYYGLVPAVVEADDDDTRPPLVTTGLIDPGRCRWGERPVRFAKQRFTAPVVEASLLDDRMRAWAARKTVPKVLVASPGRVIEAVADVAGTWLPAVPVTTVVPTGSTTVHEVAAVLTSPIASAHAWWRAAGTGMSSTSIRVGPDLVGSVPWPAGDLGEAVAALRRGDVVACGRAVAEASGVRSDHPVLAWWAAALPRS